MNGCASLWLQVLYAALAFESVTIGVAGLTYSYAFTQLAIFCGIVSLLIAFLPFVGAGLAKLDITRCVGWLLLSSLACLMVCVLVLTLLLSFNCQVTIVNLMLIGAFIAVLFSAAYDSRIVHRLNANDSLDSKQCLRYSLFLYGEMIFVWLLLLHVS
ncbi:uncharacterized protein LOC106084583 [Stomoxys calcitrans]|uniref:uncharacterized protein LOC106084583 n=1 Tax=Stomoxys calcitrans TaxID=35570 RepID=UPI0027E2E6CF|nr:uncharacterized protein LOC106084583 [Stomoxys calcitrans]